MCAVPININHPHNRTRPGMATLLLPACVLIHARLHEKTKSARRAVKRDLEYSCRRETGTRCGVHVQILSAPDICFREVDDLVGAAAHDSLHGSTMHTADPRREPRRVRRRDPAETEFSYFESRDLWHAGRTGHPCGFSALNLGLPRTVRFVGRSRSRRYC
jgi:hypothetical protein